MGIKNKVLAVSMAAAVSVISFGAVLSAKADMYQQPCYKCGEESLFSEAVEIKEKVLDNTRPCGHGNEKGADREVNRYQKRRFYCRDCDIFWEDWFYLGTFWY